MADRIEKLGRSLIQHGKGSDRVYLMKLAAEDSPSILRQMEDLARTHDYSKIFAKVNAAAADAFLRAGFVVEATVPGLAGPGQSGLFVSRFLNQERTIETEQDRTLYAHVLEAALAKAEHGTAAWNDASLHQRPCTTDDADAMAGVYRQVFESYPFPIHDPAYIRQTMASHVVYFGARRGSELVALSSAEMDRESASVEMTDFATLPSHRGSGIAVWLLSAMEAAMNERGIATAYTIARAASYGMNITFARMGYAYAGRLVNNTHIFGRLESMNVWYKSLSRTLS